jgi:hypothetical protein
MFHGQNQDRQARPKNKEKICSVNKIHWSLARFSLDRIQDPSGFLANPQTLGSFFDP